MKSKIFYIIKFVGDLLIIDENDVENNCWKANKYELDDATPAKLILTCGANIFSSYNLQLSF